MTCVREFGILGHSSDLIRAVLRGIGVGGCLTLFMATVTKKDLIDRIAAATKFKRADVKVIVQQFLDEMIDDLGRGHRLEFRDFGVLETKTRAPRTAQNPKTLERVNVPAKRTVKFKVGRRLRDRLDGDATSASVEVVVNPEAAEASLNKRARSPKRSGT